MLILNTLHLDYNQGCLITKHFSLSISQTVTNSSGGESTVQLKEKEATSYSFGTQFEPSNEPVKRPLDDNEGIVIVETALSAEKPAEEEGVCMYKRNYVSVHISLLLS